MKNIYPDQLIARPARLTPPRRVLRAGDRVTLQPADGSPAITTTVRLAIPLFGCTTYTSDIVAHTPRGSAKQMPTVFRFRWQDVHRVQHA